MGSILGHFVKQKHVAWNHKMMAFKKNYSKYRQISIFVFVYCHKMVYIFQNIALRDWHLALKCTHKTPWCCKKSFDLKYCIEWHRIHPLILWDWVTYEICMDSGTGVAFGTSSIKVQGSIFKVNFICLPWEKFVLQS